MFLFSIENYWNSSECYNSILLVTDKFLFFRLRYLGRVVMVKAINLGDQVIIVHWRRVVMMQKWSTRLDGNLSCGIWFEEKANMQNTSKKIQKKLYCKCDVKDLNLMTQKYQYTDNSYSKTILRTWLQCNSYQEL